MQADTALARGDAAAGILARIDATHPGLVAMATHGRSGVARFVRGSVAERVLRACPAPLLLANPAGLEAPRWPWRKLLVPLDGSDHAARVLPVVERLASALRAGVTLLRVDPYLAPLEARSEGYDPERAAASLEPVRRRLEAAGVATRVRVTLGVEADQILRAAEDVDLVALTTHGRSGLSRWLFGSVAEHVLRHCPRPLVVVRDAVD